MNRLQRFQTTALSLLFACICCQFGCQPRQPLYLTEKGRWQDYYKGKATQIEYPNVDIPSLPEVCNAIAPLTLDNPDPEAYWDLTLEEAIHMAMKNTRVIRTLTGVGFSQAGVSGVPSTLLQGPGTVRTVYDPALAESDPRTGPEAALAAFDAQLTANTRWSKIDTPHWNGTNTNIIGSQGDAGEFGIGISKISAPGTQFYIQHVDQYRYGGYPDTPTTWTSHLVGGFVHPLLRGGGIDFNRIAGPGATPGYYNGVTIARINTDTALVDFELATRNLVADVEKAYWNLYYAYHRLESIKSGRDSAHRTWHNTRIHADVESARGSAHLLAQAEQNFFSFQQQVELAQSNLFKAASVLRYIMGLTPSDGRLIRPVDEPITAPIKLDWHSILCEALFRSPELRKQKWAVKQRELELVASKNFLLPQLDLEASYQIAGAGKHLLGSNSVPTAYGTLTGGDYTGWTVGLNASAPFGWRREIAAVRNAQLNLAKARAMLQDQELELTHQLDDSFQEISLAYQQMRTTLSAYRAASAEVEAVGNAYEVGTVTLDQLLQAQRRQSEAQTGYHSSVINYNLAIMTLHYRKGSLLEYNNICLSEGEWPAKAYFDAKRRAKERDAGQYFDYGYTLPGVVSRGTYQQYQHGYNSTSYDVLPTQQEMEGNSYPMPVIPGSPQRVIETETTTVIPTPILPKPGSNTPVSFITPEVATPTSTLTPARNMRYVQ